MGSNSVNETFFKEVLSKREEVQELQLPAALENERLAVALVSALI